MAIKKTAVIDNDTNKVVNIIVTDDSVEWSNPEDTYTIDNDSAQIGDTFDTGTEEFIPAPAPAPAPGVNVDPNLLGALLVSKSLITQGELDATKV